MNIGKKITELREATEISKESSYLVSMGDGTGTKQVKHKTLVEQLLMDMELPYDQTLAALRAGDEEGKTMIPNLQAISDWIMSKIVNNLMTTEEGYFMDGRQGPVIQKQLDALTSAVSQLNSELPTANGVKRQIKICYGTRDETFDDAGIANIDLDDTFTSCVILINVLNGGTYDNASVINGNVLAVLNKAYAGTSKWIRYIVVGY